MATRLLRPHHAFHRAVIATSVAVGCVLSFARAANADPGVNWDAVAACESGGNWAANTGNGFYGGLQHALSTWQANGGVGMPNQASREQQISVANHVLATQGIGAWPTCGAHAHDGYPAPQTNGGQPSAHDGVPSAHVAPVAPVRLARWEAPKSHYHAARHERHANWRKRCRH